MINPTNTTPSSDPSSQPSVASTTAESTKGATQTAAAGTSSSTKTTYGSMAEFRNAEPKLYEAFMKGIAQFIMRDMQRHAKTLKRMLREQRRN